jgi:hypothetical protein
MRRYVGSYGDVKGRRPTARFARDWTPNMSCPISQKPAGRLPAIAFLSRHDSRQRAWPLVR